MKTHIHESKSSRENDHEGQVQEPETMEKLGALRTMTPPQDNFSAGNMPGVGKSQPAPGGGNYQAAANASQQVLQAKANQAAVNQSALMANRRQQHQELYGSQEEEGMEGDMPVVAPPVFQLKAGPGFHSQPQERHAGPKKVGERKNNTGLPDQLRSGIESLSGLSMEDVKVHYNSAKPMQMQAHAYAQGTDIHLGPGQEKHLPHEAWHVVQQKQGRVQATRQLKSVAINDDSSLEREADSMGAKAAALQVSQDSSSPVQQKSAGSLVAQLLAVQIIPRGIKEKTQEEKPNKNNWNNKNNKNNKSFSFDMDEDSSDERELEDNSPLIKDNDSISITNHINNENKNDDHINDTTFYGFGNDQEMNEKSGQSQEKFIIEKLIIEGRPDNRFGGSAGDHTTAFGAFRDGFILNLTGKGLRDVYNYCQDELESIKGDFNHKPNFKEASNEANEAYKRATQSLKLLGEFNETGSGEEGAMVAQTLICDLLELRELSPVATLNTKKAKNTSTGQGKGEAHRLKYLRELEGDLQGNRPNGMDEECENSAMNAMLDLFDFKAIASCILQPPSEWPKILPDVDPNMNIMTLRNYLFERHFKAMGRTYPSVWKVISKQAKKRFDMLFQEHIKDISLRQQSLVVRDLNRNFHDIEQSKVNSNLELFDRNDDRKKNSKKATPGKKDREKITNLEKGIDELRHHFAHIDEVRVDFGLGKGKLQTPEKAINSDNGERLYNTRNKNKKVKPKMVDVDINKVDGEGVEFPEGLANQNMSEIGLQWESKPKTNNSNNNSNNSININNSNNSNNNSKSTEKTTDKENSNDVENLDPKRHGSAVELTTGKKWVIETIKFGERPKSPFSNTMGAHTTSWVVHQRRAKKAVQGCHWKEAKENMGELLEEAEKMRDNRRKDFEKSFGTDEMGLMETSFQAAREILSNAAAWDKYPILQLQKLISSYFQALNCVWGMTRNVSDTRGSGEGAAINKLEKLANEMPEEVQEQARSKYIKNKGNEILLNVQRLLDIKQMDNEEQIKMLKEDHWAFVTKLFPQFSKLKGAYESNFGDRQNQIELAKKDDSEAAYDPNEKPKKRKNLKKKKKPNNKTSKPRKKSKRSKSSRNIDINEEEVIEDNNNSISIDIPMIHLSSNHKNVNNKSEKEEIDEDNSENETWEDIETEENNMIPMESNNSNNLNDSLPPIPDFLNKGNGNMQLPRQNPNLNFHTQNFLNDDIITNNNSNSSNIINFNPNNLHQPNYPNHGIRILKLPNINLDLQQALHLSYMNNSMNTSNSNNNISLNTQILNQNLQNYHSNNGNFGNQMQINPMNFNYLHYLHNTSPNMSMNNTNMNNNNFSDPYNTNTHNATKRNYSEISERDRTNENPRNRNRNNHFNPNHGIRGIINPIGYPPNLHNLLLNPMYRNNTNNLGRQNPTNIDINPINSNHKDNSNSKGQNDKNKRRS